MGILECASGASVSRGYDYCIGNKVICFSEISANVFSAKVAGSSGTPYSVELNIDHPRKSKCNCPHANGKRIICKHIVATYFTVLPEEAERYYAERAAYQEEEEKQADELADKVCDYVWKMTKSDLQQALLQLLFEGPEWQYDRFVTDNGLYDDW